MNRQGYLKLLGGDSKLGRKRDDVVIIYGVGRDDLPYSKKHRNSNGDVTWVCPFYERWRGIIRRCYSKAQLKKNPNYIGCTVCEEWLTFSNFKSWMEQQDWEGKELDKDLLVEGNKVYSPHLCLWVPHNINSFLASTMKNNRATGTCADKTCDRWRAQCKNPFATNSYEARGYIGLFETQEDAHLAWKAKKHEYACKLAELQDDPRIAEALRNRFKRR